MSSSISMAGMGTGLDVYGMAETMAVAETSAKTNQLTEKETEIDEEIAALNTMASSLNSFYNTLNQYSDASVFGSVTVNMSDDDSAFASVEVDDTAVPNTYQLEVQQLATQHKVEWMSGPSDSAVVEAGEYTLGVGEEDFTFTVEEGTNSLSEVAYLINEDPDNPGITASVLDDGETSYLTLTANESGEDNVISINGDVIVAPEDGTEPADGEPRVLQDPQDAEYTIDGVKLTSPDNSIDDVIEGVTIDLNKITTDPDDGGPVTINIEPDTGAMEESINAIIDAFNTVVSTIDDLNETTYDEDGEPVRPPLAGDTMINSIESEMRDVLYQSYNDTYSNLASIGIMTDANGKLEIDDDLLEEALEEDPDAVSDMFVDDGGVIDGFQDVAANYVGRPEGEEDEEGNTTDPAEDANGGYVSEDGLIDERVDGLREDLDDIDDEWTELETRYDSIYERYLAEYIAMDLAVAEMNNSYSYL